MNRFLVIGFDFDNTVDYCLVRLQKGDGCNTYQLTIMNGELEKLLFGNHVLYEKNGFLEVEETGDEKLDRLRLSIAQALGDLLNLPVKPVQTAAK